MGRKAHEPTTKTRAEVKALAGFGVIEDEIAIYIGVAPQTLRKYYRQELDAGHIYANVQVARSLFNQAVDNGSVSAAIFWLKARAGWREGHNIDHSGIKITIDGKDVVV